MTSPLTLLGLDADADADERAIKRAYAAKLKTVRPDEDPEGFQRLNEAYRAALEILSAARSGHRMPISSDTFRSSPGAVDIETTETEATSRGPRLSDSSPPPLPAFRKEAGTTETEPFDIARCLELASQWSRESLIAWLDAQSALWSLDGKARSGRLLLWTMTRESPPVVDHNFEALARYFGYFDLHAGHDFVAIRELQARLHAIWREARRNGRFNSAPTSNETRIVLLPGNKSWPSSGPHRHPSWQMPDLSSNRQNTSQDWSKIRFDRTPRRRPHKEGDFGLWLLGAIICTMILLNIYRHIH